MLRTILALAILPLAATTAQDGGQLYTTYCSACHAPNGEGATGGQFPPLAGSEWVEGDPGRSISIVLHGLEGEVEVDDKTYNLLMPPQGAVLPDDQIAAILTYVRSSWGNKGGKVDAAMVKKIRAATEKRNKPWTAKELLKKYPLPKKEQYLRDLTTKIYKGRWNKFPDFDSLTPEAVEEEQDGLISLEKINHKDHYGVVWEGQLYAHKDGDFTFGLDSDDEARLIMGGKVVVEIKGAGPMGRGREGRVLLKKGANPFRLEYREIEGVEGISLYWKAGGMKMNYLSKEKAKQKNNKKWPDIPITPTSGHTATYRNFIEGTTPRAIGFGFPQGVNLAYSADHLAPELVWTGAFMDGGRHWTNRGQGNQPPAGESLLKLTGSPAYSRPGRFRGYSTDPEGNPTFVVTVDGLTMRDSIKGGDRMLVRAISAEGSGTPVELTLAENLPIEAAGKGVWTVAGALELKVEGATAELADKKLVIKLSADQAATLTYLWK
ncbi:hypothetical protein HAHE_05690 [Haloferula helveola]|uniref:Cytochrome c domain-containing protein n=1 Tax=Haloferula helveola TaxID=490095 RepID=A0ABN6GZE3_9BACT|nr:hypothetical protein HAHE_05690 [Haloferula helveola]